MSDETNWQARYESADTPWDKGVPHPMIAHWAKTILPDGAIVVPGCGRGWDLRAWAQAFPQRQVIGIDLAPAAVEDARANCADLPNVSVRLADFFDEAQWHRNEEIALIWEHTCFCAIPPSLRDAYVATVARLLRQGSRLLGAFFTDMDDGGQGPPWNTPMEEMLRRFSPHFSVEEPTQRHVSFAGREGEERSIVMRRL